MCGRYVIEGNPGLSERFNLRHVPQDLFADLTTYNAAPTQLLPVIIENEAGEHSLVPMQWGLVPRVGDHKQPFYITAEDGEAWGLAGLYDQTHEDDEAVGSFTIITTQANERMSSLHERMPVILPRAAEDDWLAADLRDPHEVEQFLHPYPDDEMRVYPVSTAVNNTRNNGPQLIEEQE